MTPTEYRDTIAALGLSQVKAARLLGVGERTSRRWALGEQPVPRAAALALRLMVDQGITAEEAERALRTGDQ